MSDQFHNQHLDIGDNRIHIASDASGEFEVWLNTEVADYDGLCIGCGSTWHQAASQALETLEAGVRALRGEGATSTATSAAGGE